MKTHLDQFSQHEAMDRTEMIHNMVQTYLVGHPFMEKPEYKDRVKSISDALFQLYQDVALDESPLL